MCAYQMYKTSFPWGHKSFTLLTLRILLKSSESASKYKKNKRHGGRLKKSVAFRSRAKTPNGMARVSGQEIERDLDCRSCHHFDIRRTGASDREIEILVILKLWKGSSILGFLIWTCRRCVLQICDPVVSNIYFRALFQLSSPETSKIPNRFSPRTSFRKNETE